MAATSEEDQDLSQKIYLSLCSDIDQNETFPTKTPLLAHYTSIKNLELILQSNEIWLSNPLYMNDLQELRFGILEGVRLFSSNESVRSALKTENRYNLLLYHFNYFYDQFTNEHAFDVYVICLSEHNPTNNDGLLSMWRGYGGNGKGAAFVFDTKKLEDLPDSPLIIAKVEYASTDERLKWLEDKFNEFAQLISSMDLPDDKLWLAAWAIFERIKLFALFTKHIGFSEEQEWRVVYLKNRDENKSLEKMFHYFIGERGIEPKLRLQMGPIDGVTSQNFSLSTILHQIILGPTTSDLLAKNAVMRMLEKLNKIELKDKVTASSIPFRSTVS